MLKAALFCLLLAGAARGAESGPVSASGYFKNLWQYSRSAFDGRPYFLNTDRARLTLDASASLLKAHVDYDHEVFAGGYFRTTEHRLAGFSAPNAWLEMDHTVSSSATSLWRHRLYRGWLGIETDALVLRFGRQRIAWGTGKLWNPTDIFNPYQPISVEREQRPGTDAAYLRAAAGELSHIELAYAPQDRWPRSAALARWKSNARSYDFSLMGGKVAGSTASWVAGGDFAGDLGEGSLHGEWSYTDPRGRRPFWKALIGYEYTFSPNAPLGPLLRDASATLEYLHNGAGTTSVFRYDVLALLAGDAVSLAKDYVGLTYAKDMHPLVKLDLALIANLDDLSHFFSPTVQWNALPDLYLSAGYQRFAGGKSAEYGRLANLGFLQAQYFY